MARAADSLASPLLQPSNEVDTVPSREAAPRPSRVGVVRIVDSEGDIGMLSDSSGDGGRGEGRRQSRWGRYAALASRSRRSRSSMSCSSARSRQDVEILAKTREWGQIGDSSSEDETPGGQDRQERYARMFQDMEAEAKGVRTEGAGGESRGSRWRGLSCCAACALQNAVNASLLVLAVERRNPATVCSLAPAAAFLALLELCLASTDRSVVHERHRLRRGASAMRRLFHEAFVFLVLGCLHGYRLVQAHRHWTGAERQDTFLTDLENLDPSQRPWQGRLLWDSHQLLWSAPVVVCLTCSLATGSIAFPGDAFWYLVLTFAVCSAAMSVESFDYATSYQVRAWHGVVFDQHRWTENGLDRGGTRRLRCLHRLARLCEVLGRVLVLIPVSLAIPRCSACAVSLLVADYAVCFLALCANSGLTLEVPVVAVGLFVADLARYVDEPGFALPARRVSRVLDMMRAAQTVLAAAAYTAAAFGAWRVALPAGGAWPPLALLLLLQALGLALRRALGREGRRGDLFTAVLGADAGAMEQSLSFEGGCSVDMTLCDSSQQTALHLATAHGHLECVQLLIKHGAKRTALDAHLENPLHIAVRRRDVGIASALVQGEDSPEVTSRQAFQMVRQMNTKAETPQDMLKKDAPQALRELLIGITTEAVEADLAARVVRIDSQLSCRSRTPTGSTIMYKASSSLMNNLFGTIVGGEHFNLQLGPREKVLRAELAAFMFFRGMGEQLQRLHLYFRRSKRKQTSSRVVHVSNLRTLATLGTGGFGKVLKVEDVCTGESYALKLQCRSSTTKQAVREVQALSALSQHPYIVELIQIFRTGAFYGILMEFCDRDLNRRILEQESALGRIDGLPPKVAARYAACIMLALEYLHGGDIVFRDLKPENVLISAKDDLAKLTDFGLARTVKKQVNDDGDMMVPTLSLAAGTLGFMSSEAFDGGADSEEEEVGEGEGGAPSRGWVVARDWYSLGCCLLLMLLGEGGGRKVYAGKRYVLLPAPGGEILDLLLKAMEAEIISDEAFDLVSSLTAAKVTDRADASTCRANAFMQEAIAELEPVGLEPVALDF